MARSKRRAGLALLVAAAIGAALPSCKPSEGNSGSAQPAGSLTKSAPSLATRVEVARIESSQAQLRLTLPGEVEAGRDANLASAMGGFIEKVHVSSGDKVFKGQILALVDSATHASRARQGKVELDTANLELKRAKKLGDAIPGAQLDAAQARVNAAKAALSSAQIQVNRAIIKAPFSGIIASVDAEVGEVAAPGMTLIRLMKTDPVKVSISLSDRDVLSVRPGMAATVSTDARATVLEGVVKHVEPAADTRTRAFVAEVEVPNPDGRLLPGMIASVQLKTDVGSDQLVISQDWLVTKPSEIGVFLHADGKAHWRSIKAGSVVGNQVIIESGLKRGDELVITGHRALAAGDALLVARRGVCCREGRVVFDDGSEATKPAKATPPGADSAAAPAGSAAADRRGARAATPAGG